jgi:hypothetical protein
MQTLTGCIIWGRVLGCTGRVIGREMLVLDYSRGFLVAISGYVLIRLKTEEPYW